MTKDESEVFDLLLKAGPLRAAQIHETLHMGFHRLYQALHQLKKTRIYTRSRTISKVNLRAYRAEAY